ncbi:MAG: CoA transferase [Gammaproteobacteria bacterium]|nr:CoA transferase [Gammaproteobacteria bacterium]
MSTPSLDGVTIVDLTQFEAGPSVTETLAWHGADVIKVEPRGTGDPGRMAFNDVNDKDSFFFLMLNANKRSVTCNLKTEEGKELLRRLIEKADVVVENFSPGVIEKLGFGWEEIHRINPRCIFGQVKGFAAHGQFASYRSFDMIAQATGGMMSITGEADGPPMRCGATIGDTGTGLHMAVSIACALYQRSRTGLGQHLRVAMQDAMVNFCRVGIARQQSLQQPLPRQGNPVSGGVPDGLYPCRGGGDNDYCYIFVKEDLEAHWSGLCDAIGQPELKSDARFLTPALRMEHREDVDRIVTQWTKARPKEEVMASLGAAGVTAGAVFDLQEVLKSPDMHERGLLATFEHDERGAVTVPGWPVEMAGAVPIALAPRLGAHNEAVYRDMLGVSAQELRELEQAGVV